jgi:hypothetical protein
MATGVAMSLFGSLINVLKPAKPEEDAESGKIKAAILGAMRHADSMFSAGNTEAGMNTLLDAFNVAKIALGFSEPTTQLLIHEITLQAYKAGLNEAGLKFETIRWILHIQAAFDSGKERDLCWAGKNPSHCPDEDVRAYFQQNHHALNDLVRKLWLPTAPHVNQA